MNELIVPLRKSVERLSQIPVAFDWLRWILEAGFRNHKKLIARNFPVAPSHVLDCGCGTGIFAASFPSTNYTGIDISPKYIDRARKCNPNHRFEVMDATSLEFAGETFDAAMISGVIHHLPVVESQRMLAEVYRVLKPGGKLLLWEDVPTRSRWNFIGQVVHRLDVGEHIRAADAYLELLSPLFDVQQFAPMSSGFMDYITLAAAKPMRTIASTGQSVAVLQEFALANSMTLAPPAEK